MGDYLKAIRVDDLWNNEMVGVDLRTQKVLILKVQNQIFAFENKCPHLGFPLSEGTLEKNVLTCQAHQWQFDVLSGQGLNPEGECLKTMPTKIEEGFVWVKVQKESL